MVLTADGKQAVARVRKSGCCTDALCGPRSDCLNLSSLPSGQMWDGPKQEWAQILGEHGGLPDYANSPGLESPCPTMVSYAVFNRLMLRCAVDTFLIPAFRESDPRTAVTTVDDWLSRLGWQDCYRNVCRDGYSAQFSPYEVPDLECGGTRFSQVRFSDELEAATKHAILASLWRLRMGVIRNLCGINWVIEPLRAELKPAAYPPHVQDYLDGNCECPEGAPCFCEDVALEIWATSETIPAAPTAETFCGGVAGEEIPGCESVEMSDGTTREICPALAAAECIARSMLNQKCPNIIRRRE